jgi:ubiquinone biosynthesis protein
MQNNNRARFHQIISILRKHDVLHDFSPEKLVSVLEDLGPTFVKLGQILSMRADMIPENYCEELKKLRSEVAPMSYEEVCSVIEDSCGRDPDELFASFEREPIGSASIAQVHMAKLENGSQVVVKVQRTGIYEIMAKDVSLIRRATGMIRHAGMKPDVIDFEVVISELWNAAQEEMDFLNEAKNAEEFYELNKDVTYVSCPHIYNSLTTSKVLVMEYIEGYSINDKDSLIKNGYDVKEIATKLVNNYMKQIIDDGFFHADPHPGNIKIREGQIIWIDLGMMGRLSSRDQKLLGMAIKAVAENDIGTIKDVILTMGVVKGKNKVNHARLYTDIDTILDKYGSLDLGSMNLTDVFRDVMEVAKAHEISMPKGVSMLGRGIATMEGVIADICPDISLIQVTANHISGSLLDITDIKKELSELSVKALASGRKSLDIPSLISDLLKMTVKGQTRVNVETTGSDDQNRVNLKIADKITSGVIAAAIIMGSSLICLTDIQPEYLGMPIFAILGYLSAVVIMIRMLIKDHKK